LNCYCARILFCDATAHIQQYVAADAETSRIISARRSNARLMSTPGLPDKAHRFADDTGVIHHSMVAKTIR
jgi:hypothetical protein